MTVDKCSKCGEVKQLFDTDRISYTSTKSPHICKSCLTEIKKAGFQDKKMICIYHDYYSDENTCNKNAYHFLWNSRFGMLPVGICEHHVNTGLEYFETERKKELERKAEQERIAEENKRKQEEEIKKRKRELFLQKQQQKLF